MVCRPSLLLFSQVALSFTVAAAEPSYGYGVAYHPYGGSSYYHRSPQGLSGYRSYGKREADAGYGGYGSASVYVKQADYGYGCPQSYSYGYNIGGYGKREAEAEPG